MLFYFPHAGPVFKLTVKFRTLDTVWHLAVHKATSTGGRKCAELPFCFAVCKMSGMIELNWHWVDKRVELD